MYSLLISSVVGGKHKGIPRWGKRFCIDSRQIKEGDIFIPLKGQKFDAHLFVEEAFKRGALGFIVQKGKLKQSLIEKISRRGFVIEVENTFEALKKIASYKRKIFKGSEIIAITGTAGKTTTKELIAHLLKSKFSVYKTPGNLNSRIGLPLALANADERANFQVFEVGSDGRGNITRLLKILKPSVGVLTSLGLAHLSGFKNFENLVCAKGEIFDPYGVCSFKTFPFQGLKKIVLPARWKEFYKVLFEDRKVVLFSEGELKITSWRFTKEGKTLIELQNRKIEIPLLGLGLISAVEAALGTLQALGLDGEDFVQEFKTFKGEWGRMQPLKGENFLVIDDSYNANPLSMETALKTLTLVEGYKERVAILGDMLELGNLTVEEHKKLGLLLEELPITEVYLYGEYTRYTAEVIKSKPVFWSDKKEKLFEILKKRDHPRKGAVYLIKGSRGCKMEQFLEVLNLQQEIF
ncbi:MAG: UDP-N-acetylmuramoyl-tripeptide--D-alanyl-D-alanine ligase [Aquificota bacterium]